MSVKLHIIDIICTHTHTESDCCRVSERREWKCDSIHFHLNELPPENPLGCIKFCARVFFLCIFQRFHDVWPQIARAMPTSKSKMRFLRSNRLLICMELTRDCANEYAFHTHFKAHKQSVCSNALTKCMLHNEWEKPTEKEKKANKKEEKYQHPTQTFLRMCLVWRGSLVCP